MTDLDPALATLAAEVDAHFPARRFSVSTGRDMGRGFEADTLPAGELVRHIAAIGMGEKGDGPFWSPFAWKEGHRLAANVEHADLLVLDSDRGETLFAIEDALRAAGLAGLAIPSSSHGKRSTGSVKAAELDAWRAAIREIEGDDADTRVARFLEMERRLVPAIARTARELGRRREVQTVRTPRGADRREVELLDIAHDPVPKFRVALFLSKRWSALAYPSAGEAMRAWESAYLATIDLLGLDLDEAAADTGRLFYPTRVPIAALDAARRARRFIPGRALDLASLPTPKPRSRIPRYRKRPGRSVTGSPDAAFSGVWTRHDGSLFDLRAWAAEGGRDFRIRDALLDTSRSERTAIELDERGETEGRLHIECPFAEEHGSTRRGGTFVMNPGAGRGARGFVASCQHDACRGRDRLEFVARMLDDRILLETDLHDRQFRPVEFEPVETDRASPPPSTPPRRTTPAGADPFAGVEPLDLFAGDGLAGKPDLPAGLLPAVIEDFARDVAGRVGVEAGMPAAACIAAIAGALDDGFVVQPRQLDTEWTESARLWIQVVADPGIGKSPAIEPGIRPLRAIERRWAKEDGKTRAAYEAAIEAHKKRRIEAAGDPRPGGDAAAEPPAEPEFRRVLVDDLTTEALAGILATNPRGVLSLPDELTGWLGQFDAYRGNQGKDRPLWLRAFQGGPLTIDRATRRSLQVENFSVSILGGIQPDKLRRVAAKGELADDGLLQRFITVWGRRTGTPVDRKPDEVAGRNWRALLESIAEARPSDFGTSRVVLTPAASAVFQSVLDLSADLCALPTTSGAFRGHLSKWGAIYARLLLVVHAAQSFDVAGRMLDRVDLDTAERTRNLLVRWLLPHGAALYREVIGTGAGAKHGEWIAGFILAHRKDTVSARDGT